MNAIFVIAIAVRQGHCLPHCDILQSPRNNWNQGGCALCDYVELIFMLQSHAWLRMTVLVSVINEW